MERCNLDIAIFCAGMELNPKTLQDKSLGGSETAGVSMAHELAKLGHHVILFCNTNEEIMHDGVRYLNVDKFEAYVSSCPHDVFIGQRIPDIFRAKLKSKINILWQHDVAQKSQRASFHGCLWNLDKVFCLSDWHIDQYKSIYNIDDDNNLFFKTSNGIKLIPKPKEKNRQSKRLVYTNRPERGLDNLLFNIMPILWKADPEIELCLAGYDNTHPDMAAFYNQCYAKVAEYKSQGFKIAHLGALNKKELYELYKTCQLYVYPTAFHETSCITAMESQMCGVPMITSHLGALPETLDHKGNKLIFEDYKRNENYNKEFATAVLDLLNNPKEVDKMREVCYEKAKIYDWSNVAKQWDKLFIDIFKEKTANKNRLAKHLYEREDIMALSELNRGDLAHSDDLIDHYSYINDKEAYLAKYVALGEQYAEKEDNIGLRSFSRVQVAFNLINKYLNEEKISKPKILDFASGICNEAVQMANNFEAEVHAVNISEAEHELGEKMIEKFLKKGEVQQITADSPESLDHKYDILFLGEILEHQPNPKKFIEEFDHVLKKGALVVITVPYGLWEDGRHAHLWNFERYDLNLIFEKKDEVQTQMVSGAFNHSKQDALGWWVISYKENGKPCQEVDFERKLLVQNPRETVSVCMIVKDEESMLHRCLKSVMPIADEIIINDTGSTDSTVEIAKQYGAKIIKGDSPLEVGFDVARNETISKAKGDWIFWIDADEELIDNTNVFKYLRPNLFNGYSIKQHHFTVDAGEQKIDTPIRLFRNGQTIRFYGRIHEHPELEGKMNQGVGASTILGDVHIAHDGYLAESRRRGRFHRNINLMRKEFEENPERLLTQFLMLRDYVHESRYECEQNQGQPTPYALKCLEAAVQIWKDKFSSTPNNYVLDALMFYSEALRVLNRGLEYRFNINVGKQNVQPERTDLVARFETPEDFVNFIKMTINDKAEPHEGIFA